MIVNFDNEESELIGFHLLMLAVGLSKWSQETFGTDEQRGPIGPLKHLAKEVLCELLNYHPAMVDKFINSHLVLKGDSNKDIKEYADALILLLDSSRRAGHSFLQVIMAAREKMDENEAREWPKFDPAKVNEAVEHIREEKK